jgi:lipopolysaccharide export system protein LptC
MLLRRVVVLVVLVLGVAASGWLARELALDASESSQLSRHIPDFFMEDFVSTSMDQNGRPSRRLEAQHMAHFPDSDTNEFKKPYVVIYRDAGEPWHVTSERGWTSGEGDLMLLLGEVHIWRNGESGERKIEIETRDLRVLPESDYGETEEAVVIRSPTSVTRGTGMRAWLEQSRIELLADVRTVIERRGVDR